MLIVGIDCESERVEIHADCEGLRSFFAHLEAAVSEAEDELP